MTVQCFDGDGRDPDETGHWDANDEMHIALSRPAGRIGDVYAPYQPLYMAGEIGIKQTMWGRVMSILPAFLRFGWLRRRAVQVDLNIPETEIVVLDSGAADALAKHNEQVRHEALERYRAAIASRHV